MKRNYSDRAEAGQCLAAALPQFRNSTQAIALGLARGGVPVAAAAGAGLNIAFGALIVRKLGVPGQPETAFGALAIHQGNVVRVTNPSFVDRLLQHGTCSEDMEAVEERERAELMRRVADYELCEADLTGKAVILVDDGLATGYTMLAAVEAVRPSGPAAVVVAVPVGSIGAYRALRPAVDSIVCLQTPGDFRAVGSAYLDFGQVSDEAVIRILRR
ncbi:phosphoribosyl transferase [Paeniglutamicibacter antarcticus]|uniref:Phosphoribosyl transferase n=1 Tax=Arthrobacter terrae TaxID=2935737 RepID=A0A931CNI5_9MICC|nr:phosphoribosyltransferase family protein [Arthrobacter terrae]MBG0741483.1 phosphoribosyl transferase [Arthrobacter terrae]